MHKVWKSQGIGLSEILTPAHLRLSNRLFNDDSTRMSSRYLVFIKRHVASLTRPGLTVTWRLAQEYMLFRIKDKHVAWWISNMLQIYLCNYIIKIKSISTVY